MIQRIQSIFLLLVTALMVIFLFLPFAQFNTVDALYSFNAQGIATIGAEGTSVSTATWGVYALGAVVALVALVALFLYKNRPNQARLCLINLCFMITLYVVIGLNIYTFGEDLGATATSLSPNLILPFVAMVLDVLAYRAIRRDERLVRSLDRIR